jgi:hypothetical protein
VIVSSLVVALLYFIRALARERAHRPQVAMQPTGTRNVRSHLQKVNHSVSWRLQERAGWYIILVSKPVSGVVRCHHSAWPNPVNVSIVDRGAELLNFN